MPFGEVNGVKLHVRREGSGGVGFSMRGAIAQEPVPAEP
jgi:hypothetical protein